MYTKDQLSIIASHIENPTSTWMRDKVVNQWDSIFTFKTKDEYIAWVAAWKADYKQLSTDIRAAKDSRKESSPTYRWTAASEARTLRWQAKSMLWIRQNGKRVSWDMKKAAQEKAAI